MKRTRKIKSAATVSDDLSSPTPDVDKELPPNGTDGDSFRRKDKVGPPNQWSEEDKSSFISSICSMYSCLDIILCRSISLPLGTIWG